MLNLYHTVLNQPLLLVIFPCNYVLCYDCDKHFYACCYVSLPYRHQTKLLYLTSMSSSGSSGWLGETWNLCGHLWQSSFYDLFLQDQGHGPFGPSLDLLLIRHEKWNAQMKALVLIVCTSWTAQFENEFQAWGWVLEWGWVFGHCQQLNW